MFIPELPHILSARNHHGTGNRVSLAMDMIRRSNEILNRLENPRTAGQSSATDVEQFPEGSQSADDTGFVQPQSSVPQTQSDPDSVNVYVYIIYTLLKIIYFYIIIYLYICDMF